MDEGKIVFTGRTPINPVDFVARSSNKHSSWEGVNSTPELVETWKWNCMTLNCAINNPDEIIKYVVSAPTGTGKTENLISYCAMLPDDVKVLISTALIDEADNVASHINFEANRVKAISFHSESDKDLATASQFPIVITTHAFYKKNYSGGADWEVLMKSRDLLVIDEALDTMKEISVEDTSILRAYTIFLYLSKQDKFRNMPRFMKELKYLKEDYAKLINTPVGTNLISSDKFWNLKDEAGNPVQILSIEFDRYKLFSEIAGNPNIDGVRYTFLNKLGYNLKYSHILTGINDETLNTRIREELVATINNLNELKNRQVYITSNNGNKSFNRVTDDMFKKPVVIFDATAHVSEVYRLRQKYYNDLFLVKKIPNVRDYINVTLHTVSAKTGKREINIKVATNILQSAKLGNKTLVVTHKNNEAFFEEAFKNLYPNSKKILEAAHWNAITGLNDWHDFDTCIIAGLNHKPKFYSQNRNIVNTDNENTAFGWQQNRFNALIEDTVIISEVIQAINRIRIRKVINPGNDGIEGKCESANIYLTIPRGKHLVYKKYIEDEMPNIQIKDWKLNATIVHQNPHSHFSSVISHLDGNLKDGAKIYVYDVREALNIKPDSFKSMMGGSDRVKQDNFKELVREYGYDLIEVMEKDTRGRVKKLPTKYFYKIY